MRAQFLAASVVTGVLGVSSGHAQDATWRTAPLTAPSTIYLLVDFRCTHWHCVIRCLYYYSAYFFGADDCCRIYL